MCGDYAATSDATAASLTPFLIRFSHRCSLSPRSSSDLQTLPDLLSKVRSATLQVGSSNALEHPLTSMLKGRNYIGIDDVMSDVARLRDMGLPYEDKKLVHEIRRLTHATRSRLQHITATNPLTSKKTLLGKLLKIKHSVGNSALMLSGGGSITMYHLGTIRALIEAGVYKSIPVISGTSGGSIAAAMTACKTESEVRGQETCELKLHSTPTHPYPST